MNFHLDALLDRLCRHDRRLVRLISANQERLFVGRILYEEIREFHRDFVGPTENGQTAIPKMVMERMGKG